MPRISAQELAELVPCTPAQVQRLAELGILEPQGGDDSFDSSQVHVVRLMAGFEGAGISVDDVARGVRSGQLSFPLGLFMPEPTPLTTTYEEIAAAMECPVGTVRSRIFRAREAIDKRLREVFEGGLGRTEEMV